MRLNVVLTDEQNEAITERTAAEGIPGLNLSGRLSAHSLSHLSRPRAVMRCQ